MKEIAAKLEMLVSGYKINEDDAIWLRAILAKPAEAEGVAVAGFLYKNNGQALTAADMDADTFALMARSDFDGEVEKLVRQDDHLAAQQSAQPEFCCEHSYKVAKQAAWGARDLTHCQCDHNEYCEHCWPDDFREGGKWHGGFETKQSAPERVSVPVELLERVCWPVVSGSDRHTHSEAVAELRALLASHGRGEA